MIEHITVQFELNHMELQVRSEGTYAEYANVCMCPSMQTHIGGADNAWLATIYGRDCSGECRV